jgi:hypothetical protein
MLYPSIQEILKATEKDGEERLNKYSVTMATAKCARMITNEYIKERHAAEKKVANKETDKDLASLIKKEYRDEKAVKNALREMKNGEYEVFLPGEEGYEDSSVIIENYVPTEKIDYIPKPIKTDDEDEDDDTDDIIEEFDDFDEEIDSAELMGADEVFNNDSGYSIEDGEEK